MTYGTSEQFGAAIGAQPPPFLAGGRYEVRLAESEAEVEAALALRFRVFNLELNEGLEGSYQTGLDRDRHDADCEHLLAIDRFTGEVVGTYRLTTIERTGNARSFYSSSEYALDQLPDEVWAAGVEIGRACIAPDHRNKQVLFLLWRALIAYVVQNGKRFLFGCCSLNSQNPADGLELFDQFGRRGNLHPEYCVPVQPAFACDLEPGTNDHAVSVKIPRLLNSYLGMGAKVCSPPALDREFKTIDFLVLFDVRNMHPRARRLFGSVLEGRMK